MSIRSLFEDGPYASLVSLPQELLDHVANNLSCNADIAALSQTCRDLHCRTINALYQTVKLIWFDNRSITPSCFRDEEPSISPRVDLLLRTILVKPQYAKAVTCIDFQSLSPFQKVHPWAKTTIQVVPSQHVVCSALEALPRANLKTPMWIAAVKQNLVGAMIALVLWHCPNIRELRIGRELVRQNEYLAHILWDKLEPQHTTSASRWHALSSVTIQDQTQEENHPNYRSKRGRLHAAADDMPPGLIYLWSPRLSQLTLNLGRFTFFKEMQDCITCTSLTTLRLPESCASPTALGQLLRCTPALKSLDYESCMGSDERFEFVELSDALAHVKDTLESFRYIFHNPPLGRPIYISLGPCDLRHLASLTSLCISLRTVQDRNDALTSHALPKGLKELWLIAHEFDYQHNCVEERTGEIIQNAKTFIDSRAWRQFLPHLERLYMSNVMEGDWVEWEFKDKLQDVCERNGLEYASGRIWDV